MSRQHAWRLVTGARTPTAAQALALDKVLALGAPKSDAERKQRHPLYAVARHRDGEFVLLFLLGGGGRFGLPLIGHRSLAEYCAGRVASAVADAVAVPIWPSYAAAKLVERSIPSRPTRGDIVLVENVTSEVKGFGFDPSVIKAYQGFIAELCSGLVNYALLEDRALISSIAETVEIDDGYDAA